MSIEEMRIHSDSSPEGPSPTVVRLGKKKGKVCVTGGAGFVASWLIKKLLQGGYSVRATIRSDLEFKEETEHLTSHRGTSENLDIFDADLTRPESFVPAIEGCVSVFYVATPTYFGAEDYDQRAAQVAVEGVLGVLRDCPAAETVRRVVYTSSASAVVFSGGATARRWGRRNRAGEGARWWCWTRACGRTRSYAGRRSYVGPSDRDP